jgi:hypothetical protein
VVIVTLLLFATCSARAALEAHSDAYVVDENSTFRLTIRSDSSSSGGELDPRPLLDDFEVLSQQSASQFRSINGRIESSLEWVLTLRPRRSGELTIPALTLGNERTAPFTIAVRPLDPALRDALARRVYFETTVSSARTWVQSQVVVRRSLYYVDGAQLYGELPSRVAIHDAIVQPLGEPRHASVLRDDGRYGVIEESFAVFPERSGEIVVPSVAITASIVLPSPDGRGQRRTELKVSSDPVTIDVLPIPAEYPPGAPWLPAENVEILEDWPASTEPLDVGTPRRRTLLVRAEGSLAATIPPLGVVYPSDLRTYPDTADLRDQATTAGMVGLRTESADLVATRPGRTVLPEVTLTWWDTRGSRVRTTVLPARPIDAVGEAIAETPTVPAAAVPDRPPDATSDRASDPTAPTMPWTRILAWSIAALCVVAVLLALRPVASRGARHLAPRLRRWRAYRKLARACRGGDAAIIRGALDAWLPLAFAAPPEVARRRFLADDTARGAIADLDRALYGDDSTTFDGARLVDAARRARQSGRRTARAPEPPLPRLYPTG